MQTAAIIAEYNPFHNGHAHHIADARKQGATHVMVIMSGNYVQRGAAALFEKRLRVHAALLEGADLVLELPMPYAVATAQRFAKGAVTSLAATGCVDLLSFGAECADVEKLRQVARLIREPALYEKMREGMADGATFAAARQWAMTQLAGPELGNILAEPNNILAVEYLRELEDQALAIRPIVTARAGVNHDQGGVRGGIASASHIREVWQEDREQALALVPKSAATLYRDAAAQGQTFCNRKLDISMLSVLRKLTKEELSRLPDLSEGLQYRLYEAIRDGRNVEEIQTLAKTRRYTMARIRRLMFSAYLGLTEELATAPVPYLRVLGLRATGTKLLAQMRETATLPVSDSLAKLEAKGGMAARFAQVEAAGTDLYRLCQQVPGRCGSDYTDNAIRLVSEDFK